MNEANKKLASIDEAVIKQLLEDLLRLRNDYNKFKDDTTEKINNILD